MVGGLSTAVDLGGFVALRALGASTLIASPTSFLAGTAFNYAASVTLAFRRGRRGRVGEVGALLAVAGVGLALNSGFVWAFVSLGLAPALAKTLAVPCVLAWNFLGRRWLVFQPELPDATWALLGGEGDQGEDRTSHSSL